MNITYYDSTIPTGQEYSELIATTGWEGVVEKGYDKLYEAISNSWYLVCAYDGDRLVGSGRIVADGVYQAFITDVLVLPEYQDQGIGKSIVKKLLKKCKDEDVLLVSLFAAKDMSAYYQRMGFIERVSDCPGMRWVDRNIEGYSI
jgi:N-acetylglutamate synthase-like GNAT family acetyltransferase